MDAIDEDEQVFIDDAKATADDIAEFISESSAEYQSDENCEMYSYTPRVVDKIQIDNHFSMPEKTDGYLENDERGHIVASQPQEGNTNLDQSILRRKQLAEALRKSEKITVNPEKTISYLNFPHQ